MEMTVHKCTLCPKEYDSYRSLVSHSNKIHGGRGVSFDTMKWCNGCQAYRDHNDFYKLNDGVYSECKDCSNQRKKEWTENTTKGFMYKHSCLPSYQERYNNLVKWALKNKYGIKMTKDEYLDILINGVCSYCQRPLQGVADIEVLQPGVGLCIGNIFKTCMICKVKRKYNLK